MKDMRFDLLSNVTASGDGVAYIAGMQVVDASHAYKHCFMVTKN
jgi:hypothetical protein